jgi:two-component system, OmpR family, sensor histidine kinase SenX3
VVLGIVAGALAVLLWRVRRTSRRDRRLLASVAAALGSPAGTGRLDVEVTHLRRRLETTENDRDLVVATLTGADLGILISDDDGEVLFANPAAEQYLGARHGKAVAQVRVRQLIQQVIATGSPAAIELNLYTPVRRVLRLRALPVADGGTGAGIYIEDLTEGRRIDAMRRDFVANVSHELKTPLGALAVLAEALRDTADPVVAKRLTDRLGAEAARMARLVDDILDLSEIESSRARHEPLDLREVVAAGREAMALRAADAGVVVAVEPCDDPLEVVGDRQQLVSAVANLVENAIKYSVVMPDHGEPPTVWLRTRIDGDDAVVEVQDEGIGIAERHQQRIFERFYRVDRARSRETGGTGLGLSIVRNVVRNHAGTVTVTSKEGVGSTFTMRLPLRGV